MSLEINQVSLYDRGRIVAGGGSGGGSGTWTTPVSAEAGDDTITFVDSGITENATIDIYSKNTSNIPISYLELSITSGQLEMTIEPLEEDTDFKLHIF